MTVDTHVKVRTEVIFTEFDGDYILMHLSDWVYCGMNRGALAVWDLLNRLEQAGPVEVARP